MPSKTAFFCGLALTLGFMQGCVTMPKETAMLNTILGNQIAESKKMNMNLIEDWANQRKERAEVVLHYNWTPKFIIKFLDNPVVKNDMNRIVCEDKGKFDRAFIIQDIVEAISKEIEKRRQLWFGTIETERLQLLNNTRSHYEEIEKMHMAISANIQSVVKGGEFEKDIREALMRPLKEIAPIDKASRKLDELLEDTNE